MNEYSIAAKDFKPDKIEFLFIAESPPNIKEGEKPRYFYFTEKTKADYLFKGIMSVLCPNKQNSDKKCLLNEFKKKGFFLIDASEKPINQKNKKERDKVIKKNIPRIVQKLEEITDNDTKIILVKKNVYEILLNNLGKQNPKVINTEHLDFPSTGNQNKFRKKLKDLLQKFKYSFSDC